MESKMIDVRGVSLAADVFGHAKDPAVLLVMGAASSGVWWPEGLCRALSAHGRFVVRYDHRDTGRSTANPPGDLRYGVDDLAGDAVSILDALGIGGAHFVGMSLGGYLSQIVALTRPERVLSLTLVASERVGPQPPGLPSMSPAVLEYLGKAAELDWADRRAVIEFQIGAWRIMAGSAHPFDEALIAAMAAEDFDRTPNLATTFNHAQLQDVLATLPPLETLATPTLILHGTKDPVLPYAHALALKDAIAGSRLVPLAGTGHELHPHDWPTIVREIIEHTTNAERRALVQHKR